MLDAKLASISGRKRDYLKAEINELEIETAKLKY
jgi:hypothetical protein